MDEVQVQPFVQVPGLPLPDYNTDSKQRFAVDASVAGLLVDEYEGERDTLGR